jgi:ATP-dependent DNA ligase
MVKVIYSRTACPAVPRLSPITPTVRREPFDDPAWLFDLKLDGFRGMADTINYRMVSKNGKRLQWFVPLLDNLPS